MSDETDQIIDQIQNLRGKNNANWMDLVRLSMNCRPAETKVILSRILRKDEQIHDTLARLVADDGNVIENVVKTKWEKRNPLWAEVTMTAQAEEEK